MAHTSGACHHGRDSRDSRYFLSSAGQLTITEIEGGDETWPLEKDITAVTLQELARRLSGRARL